MAHNLLVQFIKIILHYNKIGYNINVLQQTACLVVNQTTDGNSAFLFNCTQVCRTSGGQSRDTHVVISHVLFSFFARFKVCFTIIFLLFGGFQKCHLVQSTQTRKLFLMALKF